MTKDSAAIRDQLGNDPDTTFFLNADYSESIGLEEQSTTISTKTLGHAWIVGTTTNGIVGVNTGTEDGLQQVVGGAGRVETIIRVVNPNNVFNEHFRSTDFKDSVQPNTADWDTTNFRISMSSSTNRNRAYNTVATSKSIFLNSQTVLKAIVNSDETIFDNDVIKYFLSADGGNNWEEFIKNTERAFTNSGNDLRFRVVFFGNGANTTYLENLRVGYSV